MRFDLDPLGAAAAAVAPGSDSGGGLAGLARVLAEAECGGTGEDGAAQLAARARLGALSERYESGGRGPGTVSSGKGDPGGVSYGLYQLASKTGTVAAFLTAEGAPWSGDFGVLAPGSEPFSAAWRAVAAREGEAFGAAQHAFIERSHYRPLVRAVAEQTGLDLDGRADAVRDACWSCAVQHGGAARFVARAVGRADAAAPRESASYDRALVEAIYAERCAYVLKIAARADPATRRTLTGLVEQRYADERRRALAMLG